MLSENHLDEWLVWIFYIMVMRFSDVQSKIVITTGSESQSNNIINLIHLEISILQYDFKSECSIWSLRFDSLRDWEFAILRSSIVRGNNSSLLSHQNLVYNVNRFKINGSFRNLSKLLKRVIGTNGSIIAPLISVSNNRLDWKFSCSFHPKLCITFLRCLSMNQKA